MGENSCGEESRVGVAMRWTTDPGAIPGEPYGLSCVPVGQDGEIGDAKAVIIEIQTPEFLVGKLEHSSETGDRSRPWTSIKGWCQFGFWVWGLVFNSLSRISR